MKYWHTLDNTWELGGYVRGGGCVCVGVCKGGGEREVRIFGTQSKAGCIDHGY